MGAEQGGETSLYIASYNGRVEAVKALLEERADLEAVAEANARLLTHKYRHHTVAGVISQVHLLKIPFFVHYYWAI